MQNLQRWEVDDSQRNVSNALGPDPPHNWPQSTKRQIQCQPPAPQTLSVSGFSNQRQSYLWNQACRGFFHGATLSGKTLWPYKVATKPRLLHRLPGMIFHGFGYHKVANERVRLYE